MQDNTKTWDDDYADAEEPSIDEYDISANPNDFNILTIFNFIESGAVKIPGFQRNFVWDIGRSSKLIESLLLGLPVPQIFLYETERNSFLVIDGQQRLMSIYYFIKQRFPRKDKRTELRTIFDEKGKIPDEVLHDDKYFENFRLKLGESLASNPSKFKGLSYSTLGQHKIPFELRTIRNVIIKQNSPSGDDSSMYEVFNRLNTGGINLKPQEIRMSMYHSPFYELLLRLNSKQKWRRLLPIVEPDIHMKDVEILLRAFAMLVDGEDYSPSMVKFLNKFSRKNRSTSSIVVEGYQNMFDSFLAVTDSLPRDVFVNKKNGRFHVALFESAFAAACHQALTAPNLVKSQSLLEANLSSLANDDKFVEALQEGTTQSRNVKTRLRRAREILLN